MTINEDGSQPSVRSPVAKALQVLPIVAAAPHPLRMTEVADALGVIASTASRTLRDLTELGWLYRNEEGRFALGPRAQQFGAAATRRFLALRNAAAFPLAATADDLELMVNLQVMHPRGSQVIAVARSERYRNVLDHEWDVIPVHQAAGGIALLSALPDSFAEWATRQVAAADGEDAALELRERLRSTSQRGFAFQSGTVEALISSVGVPLRTIDGAPIGAVAAVGLITELDEARAGEVAERLGETTSQIQALLADGDSTH